MKSFLPRRAAVAGLASSTLAFGAGAQPAPMPLLGCLSTRPIAGNELLAAFRSGLAEQGYLEGRTVAIDYRSSNGRTEGLALLATELVRLNPALIFAASSGAAVAAKAATTTVPIVFTGSSDPVRLGLVASLARPGGNLTGATRFSHAIGPKRLQLVSELVPEARVVAVLVNPGNPNARDEIADINAAAASLNIETAILEAASAEAIEQALTTLAGRRVKALYILDDPFFTGRMAELVAGLAIRHRIAAVSTSQAFVRDGALASYGADFAETYRQCALLAARILKGARPADLPVMLPTRYTLTLNLKTAKALGIVVPPSIVAGADEVIE